MTTRWVAVALSLGFLAAGETRRAVVVGINEYQHRFTAPPVARPLEPRGTTLRNKWVNLDGAVSDAREMRSLLLERFGFDTSQVHLLVNEQATAEAILTAIRRHLVDEARPGDIALFYYAGHGAQVRNTKSDESDGLDETLVPADAIAGAADIRDRELGRLYRQAVAKGVRLTVILDSCHSGSGARGAAAFAQGTMRRIENDTRYVEDPPDRDLSGRKLPAAEDMGALVLSAAQDYEPAFERVTDSGPHGLFSWALFAALRSSPPKERVDRLFQRVRALMQSEGAKQEPVMAGKGRGGASWLGLEAESGHVVTAAALMTAGGQVRLQVGAAANVTEGCEFRRKSMRLRVTKVLGVNLSETVAVEGDPSGIVTGDLFELDRWAVEDASALRVFVGGAVDESTLRGWVEQARKTAAGLGVEWVTDPVEHAVDAVLAMDQGRWQVRNSSGAVVSLGASPVSALLAATLREWKTKSMFFRLPAVTGLVAPNASGGNIVVVDAHEKAHYVLMGRAEEKRIAYAWVLPGEDGNGALPARSDWFELDASEEGRKRVNGLLAQRAGALARIRGWLLLNAPPSDLRFPYRLALRKEGTGEKAGDHLDPGARYKLHLEAVVEAGARVSASWVYVFAIDSHGKGTLLFPEKGRGNTGNRFPIEGNPASQPSIALTAESYDVEVSPPYGVDSYFLLVSKDALPNPDVLDFDGVRQAGRGEMTADPLTRLLVAVAEGTRGQRPPLRATWTMYRETFHTKKEGR